MASPNVFVNGIGGSSGAALATGEPFLASGEVYYVSSSLGADSGSGKDRGRPWATLAFALTQVSANDTVTVLANHTETFDSGSFSTAGLTIIGEGTGANRPRFAKDSDTAITFSGAGVTLWNLWFSASSAATTAHRVILSGASATVKECYFESGTNENSASACLSLTGSNARIIDTTIISTATTAADQGYTGISIGAAITDLLLDGVTFDGGAAGWSAGFAFVVAANAITRLKMVNVDLLNDSDITLATGTTGWIMTRNTSGSARIVWAA